MQQMVFMGRHLQRRDDLEHEDLLLPRLVLRQQRSVPGGAARSAARRASCARTRRGGGVRQAGRGGRWRGRALSEVLLRIMLWEVSRPLAARRVRQACGRPARGAGGPDRMHPMCVSAALGVGARGASDRRVRVARAGEDPQALHGRNVAVPALR
jgi:hypothetical protein